MPQGLPTDEEWTFIEPPATVTGLLRGCLPASDGRGLDAIFWVARTAIPWCGPPPELGDWNLVRRQYRRWTISGLHEVLLQALGDGVGDAGASQMIESTIARACPLRACPLRG